MFLICEYSKHMFNILLKYIFILLHNIFKNQRFLQLNGNNHKHTLNVCTAYVFVPKIGNYSIYRLEFDKFLDIYFFYCQKR